MSTAEKELDYGGIDKILGEFGEVNREKLIPLLQEIQDYYGYLPPEILQEISKRTGLPTSYMYGVATFYEQFHLEPRGKHIIRCCRGTACHVRGGHGIIESIKNELGLEEGQTSKDLMFTLETVACLGACALAPVIVVDGVYYGKMNSMKAITIIKQLSMEEA